MVNAGANITVKPKNLPKNLQKPKNLQSHASQPQQTNVNKINITTTKCDDDEPINYITSYQQLYDQVYDPNFDSDSDDNVAAISSDATNQLETLNAKNQYGKITANSMIDSGGECSVITKTLANKIIWCTQSARWITSK